MVGRTQSEAKKHRERRRQHDYLMERAVQTYHIELKKKFNRKGARTICQDFEELHWRETGHRIRLCYQTLIRRANGKPSRADRAAKESWLTEGEADVVLDYVKEMAKRGFPLSHRRLKEHVDEILQARLGDKFPPDGVGHNWTHRFVEKHNDHLHTTWARPLEAKRGRAVNPHTNMMYYDMLENTINTHSIEQECTYAADEVGFQTGSGQSERVIGGKGKGPQYQQKDGDRENITVIVSICADGTSVPPAVIMKGAAYQVRWKQDNPANASLGYSKKGWTDGEIGLEWIKQFDKQTAAKAAGRDRLLLVDGHNSHYTRGFLEYARTHHIHVLCYPSHATHVYQGLDVAVFGVLKRYWGEERDRWQREKGGKIDKSNFLTVYGAAHLRALTPETVRAAFRKTGVWPLDRGVITDDMLAPSKETSCEGYLPVQPVTPVRIVAKLLQDLSVNDQAPDPDTHPLPALTQLRHTAMEHAVQDLRGTSQGATIFPPHLAPPTSPLGPAAVTHLISPVKQHDPELLALAPQTSAERHLLQALEESHARETALKKKLQDLQATNVLNTLYCNSIRSQLAHFEKKKASKVTGKLVGDGLPRLLTGDEFYERVVQFAEWQEREDAAKEARKDAKKRRDQLLEEWRAKESARKQANVQQTKKWQEDVEQWNRERAAAKAENRPFNIKKPLRGKLAPAIPKPKVTVVEEDSCDEDSDEDGEERESDG